MKIFNLSHSRLLFVLSAVFCMSPKTLMASEPKITGTFIQYQSWMMSMSHEDWTRELDTMRAAGIDTIVLQWLKYDKKRFYPVFPFAHDTTEIILNYADTHNMRVMLGLNFDSGWWTKWNDAKFLAETSGDNVKLVRRLWKHYMGHPSLYGWYIPYEISDSDYSVETMASLRKLLSSISAGCKSVAGDDHPVALSIFFQANLPAVYVESVFTNLLMNSKIDLLMVQDGVGAMGWQDQIDTLVPQYLQAFRNVAQNLGIPSWTILENFSVPIRDDGTKGAMIPGNIERIRHQLSVEAPLTDKIITFDFFHYMSPFRGDAQKKLFDDYMATQNAPEQSSPAQSSPAQGH